MAKILLFTRGDDHFNAWLRKSLRDRFDCAVEFMRHSNYTKPRVELIQAKNLGNDEFAQLEMFLSTATRQYMMSMTL